MTILTEEELLQLDHEMLCYVHEQFCDDYKPTANHPSSELPVHRYYNQDINVVFYSFFNPILRKQLEIKYSPDKGKIFYIKKYPKF